MVLLHIFLGVYKGGKKVITFEHGRIHCHTRDRVRADIYSENFGPPSLKRQLK